MSKFKGTKGKWILNNTKFQIVNENNDPLCDIWNFNKPINEWKANAKLIAYAPEMLDRMKEALKVIDWYMENTKPDNGYETFFNIGANEKQQLEDLIKKATE